VLLGEQSQEKVQGRFTPKTPTGREATTDEVARARTKCSACRGRLRQRAELDERGELGTVRIARARCPTCNTHQSFDEFSRGIKRFLFSFSFADFFGFENLRT